MGKVGEAGVGIKHRAGKARVSRVSVRSSSPLRGHSRAWSCPGDGLGMSWGPGGTPWGSPDRQRCGRQESAPSTGCGGARAPRRVWPPLRRPGLGPVFAQSEHRSAPDRAPHRGAHTADHPSAHRRAVHRPRRPRGRLPARLRHSWASRGSRPTLLTNCASGGSRSRHRVGRPSLKRQWWTSALNRPR